MAQVKAVFYVPRRDNDGRDLQAEIEDLLDELYARFLGWTFLGSIEGAYRMADGTRSLDESGSYPWCWTRPAFLNWSEYCGTSRAKPCRRQSIWRSTMILISD